jgi:hypothetical protein
LIRIAALGVVYAALTAIVVQPLIDFRHLDIASYEGDARLLIWTMAWNARAVLTGTPLFDANIYYPEAHALSYAEHHAGIGLFAVPLYAATGNPVLTYWVLWLLAFPLNGLAMHALAWRVTRDHVAALTAGCIYAFCFFRMHHAHGHLQLLWTWTIPLGPIALDDWLESPRPGRAAAVTAAVLLASLTSWYLAVFVTLLLLASLVCLVPGRTITMGHIWQAVAAVLLGTAIVGWFAWPYFRLTTGPLAEAAANAADLRSYLLPPANTWLGQMLIRHTSVEPRWIWGEQTLSLGVAVLTFSAAGLLQLRAPRAHEDGIERLAAAVLIAGGVALGLSFGPTSTGLSPFDLLSRLPGLSLLRAPARFALLVVMAVALLSALGVTWLREKFAHRARFGVAALLAVFFLESFVVAFPAGKPQRVDVPAAYRMLATLPRGAVLSLPSYRSTPEAFRETDYLLFSTAHWQPIVNGFGRQEPPEHAGRMNVLAGFPSADSIALMRRLGIRYVVVHTGRASELASRVDDARRAAVRLLHSADGDFLFELPRPR